MCKVGAYQDFAGGPKGYESLLQLVQRYFCSSSPNTTKLSDKNTKIWQTQLPPIFLQRPGHSLTIIGFEKRTNRSTNLLVFDPAFNPSKDIRKAVGCVKMDASFKKRHANRLLKAYRRGQGQLQRYSKFETLFLANLPPQLLSDPTPPDIEQHT